MQDPLEEVFNVAMELVNVFGYAEASPELIARFALATEFLSNIEPLLQDGTVHLAPLRYGMMHPSIQEASVEEVNALKIAADQVPLVADMKVHGNLAAALGVTPIAQSERQERLLKAEYGFTERDQSVAAVVARFVVPGVENMPVKTILALRTNEPAFARWRHVYGEILAGAGGKAGDQPAFAREFREKAEALLPVQHDMQSQKSKSASFAELGVDVAVGVGAVLLAASSPLTVPVAATSAAVVSLPLAAKWVIKKAMKRWSSEAQSASLLRESFGYLGKQN